jgi:hypothetical protein
VRTALLFILCCAAASPAAAVEMKRDDDIRPIIAQMLHNPAAYAQKRVTIYGLVIERETPSVFVLQDVSQRPLKIIGKRGVKASVGDQVTVRGTLTRDKAGSYVFVARSLIETRVLGGGGCC